jgi:signal transduction histidine kinase
VSCHLSQDAPEQTRHFTSNPNFRLPAGNKRGTITPHHPTLGVSGPQAFHNPNNSGAVFSGEDHQMTEPEMQNHTTDDEIKKLMALVAEYENRIDEIADLVSRVRHEINNPLTGILGQAQLLLREDLNEKARHRAETIEQLARRLAATVADLRQVQKPARATPETTE